ncbi:fungal-specific transcription factor domain-containing protein [Xylariaceae sp. FL1019]|nr:fungal-specific transcription factor domain-containing protein [Xylariaceae sp. FL1019]
MGEKDATPSPRRRHLGRGRNTQRLRLACQRCQKRKIRCNGELPACSNCQSAGATCTDGESIRLKDTPRAWITHLERRVAWLESIVRARCPDVDLAQETPSVTEDTTERITSIATNDVSSGSEASTTAPNAIESADDPPIVPDAPDRNSARPGDRHKGGSHEIALVSVGGNQDARYIGPSSGYFLARVLLTACTRIDDSISAQSNATGSGLLPFPCELIQAVDRPAPIPPRSSADYLCRVYFEMIHIQYPLLHRPNFINMVDKMYASSTPTPEESFQVYMVLAIGASVGSHHARLKALGDSCAISALQYFEKINVQNSLQGLQCLLLLYIYAIHSPSARLNVWYLNYQCIAAVLDLGLQRNITVSSGISKLEQELRTRVFWCILTLDRVVATIMGRPIGLRDEACELRLPEDIDDARLGISDNAPTASPPMLTHMSFSIHLFRLAKLNTEIKYVANSIVHDPPRYAFPPIADIHDWQASVLNRLDTLASDLDSYNLGEEQFYIHAICQLRYHSIRMLLLSPSPGIPRPSTESLIKCHSSAQQSIKLCNLLYKRDMLPHSWITFHSLVLSTVTMLYCVRMVPGVASQTGLDALRCDMTTSLSILSALGEHWPGAKRCRDVLEELAGSVFDWGKNVLLSRYDTGANQIQSRDPNGDPSLGAPADIVPPLGLTGASGNGWSSQLNMDSPWITQPSALDVWPLPELFAEPFDMDAIMGNFFGDFTSAASGFI